MLQHSRLLSVKLLFLHSQHTLLSWAAINRVTLRGKRNKQKTTPLPLIDTERLKNDCTSQMWARWPGGLPRAHTHPSCCPQPEARGRQLQAGCRVGSSLVEPTSHLGLQGKNSCGARSRLARVNGQV